MSHSLRWAPTDYAVPDVLFARCDAGIEVSWCPQEVKPESLFPLDRQGPPATGPRAGRGSLHLSEPFFGALPADDWAA